MVRLDHDPFLFSLLIPNFFLYLQVHSGSSKISLIKQVINEFSRDESPECICTFT